MNMGELLDHTITLYRKNFLTLIGIVSVVSVPYMLAQIAAVILALPTDATGFSRRASNPFSDSFLLYFAIILAIAIPIGILYIFQHGALTVVASEFFMGKRAGIKQAYGRAFRRGWTLFGTQFVIGLANVMIFGLLFFPIIGLALLGASGGGNSAAAAGLGLATICICLAFVPALALAVVLNVLWIFWSQTIMLENKGLRAGLGRSWGLVRGSFWRVLLIAIVAYIFIATITATPTYAISILALMLPQSILATALNSAVSTLIGIFITPLWYSLLTLLYYDIRIRKEGFDLELQARQLTESIA